MVLYPWLDKKQKHNAKSKSYLANEMVLYPWLDKKQKLSQYQMVS
jgi:hypothetical protein